MSLSAPHDNDSEPLFPTSLRPANNDTQNLSGPGSQNWRFRVPDGRVITFLDLNKGLVSFTAGEHFGDFLVWRFDGFPSYEFAVVVDDHHMQISEVVRGEDLLLSTARQILLYEALQFPVPSFLHTPLVVDQHTGKRIAKRDSPDCTLRLLRQASASHNCSDRKEVVAKILGPELARAPPASPETGRGLVERL